MAPPKTKRPRIPREGILTLDTLIILLKNTLFNPTLTLPVLLTLQYVPAAQELVRTYDDKQELLKRFRTLVVLGVLGRLNALLSWGALNNWRRVKFNPADEIAVVTGGAQGIGMSIVKGLSAAGIKVVVLDIQPLSYTPDKNVYYFKVDLSSADEIASVAQAVRIQVGSPTILINNAGICRGRTILDSSARDVELTFAVNASAHFHLTREFLPAMVKRDHGHIVTVASIAGYVCMPGMVDYSASKAAAISFYEGLSHELRFRYNALRVRASLVTQGYSRTPLFEGFVNRSSFMLPSLEPETVAEAVVDQVLSGNAGHVVLPRASSLLMTMRGWSHWVQNGLRARTQGAMLNYKGKQVMT